MRSIINFFIKQSVLGNLSFLLFIITGWIALNNIPIDRYPNIQMDKVIVTTFYYGASCFDVEREVTVKIEEALENMGQIEYIKSKSYRNRSVVTVKFEDDSNTDDLYDELRIRVLSMMKDLPKEVDEPTFAKVEVDVWLPVVQLNLMGKQNNRALSILAEELKSELKSIDGIREVVIRGKYEREFHLTLSPEKMMRYGITYNEIIQTLRQENIAIPAGYYQGEDLEIAIEADNRFHSPEQVLKTILKANQDSLIRLSDVSVFAEESHRDPDVIVSVNGQPSVSVVLLKKPSADAISILKEAKPRIDKFLKAHQKQDLQISFSSDSTKIIGESINILTSNLITGIVLVGIVLGLFLGWFNALLATLGIPFAFLTTLIFMYFTQNSINEISLFSFVMVAGIIVDDAIVVIENVDRHYKMGKPIFDACSDGTMEILYPLVNATLTTVAAFLPMLIMSGSVGDFFAIIPKAVSLALLSSLFESIVILPMHIYEMAPRVRKHEKKRISSHAWVQNLKSRYIEILDYLLDRKKWVMLGTLGVFIFSMVLLIPSLMGKAQFIRFKFFPDDPSQFQVQLKFDPGTKVQTSSQAATEVSAFLLNLSPKIKSCVAVAGMDFNDDYEDMFGHYMSLILGEFSGKREMEWKIDGKVLTPEAFIDWVRDQLKPLESKYQMQVRISLMKDGPPTGKPVNVRVIGENPQLVNLLSEDLLGYMQKIQEQAQGIQNKKYAKDSLDKKLHPFWGLTQIQSDKGGAIQLVRFKLKKDQVARYGLSAQEVIQLATGALKGIYVDQFIARDEQIDFLVKVDHSQFKEISHVLDLPIIHYQNGILVLSDLVEFVTVSEPVYLNRFQGKPSVNVSADLIVASGLSSVMVNHTIDEYFQKIRHQYPGVVVNFVGEQEATSKSYQSLSQAFLIAFLIIYVLLAVQFRSYLLPLVVSSAILFAFMGVILGAFVSRQLFTVNSMIAIVGLAGMVVNDSLVLMDFIHRSVEKGVPIRKSILNGCQKRLKPIVLTTLTTTLGLLPLAIGIPYKSLVWGTMGMVFVTGLSFATLLTLFVIPIEYAIYCHFKFKGQKI